MKFTPELRHQILVRGVSEIIVESELVDLLQSDRPLTLKMGFDPSAPDLHLGHSVGLRKLRQLQDIGHKVVVIVGDWTAQIGDPSGKSSTRPMLTSEQVKLNAETYLKQFFKVVDKDKTEVRLQSDWFGPFGLADVINLTRHFTVAQFLARDDFEKRFSDNQPIAITELLYPLLQAYDSVAIKSDIEFGGTDQKFNLLVGRDLQKIMGQNPQQCFLMPILVGTDGKRRMGKSLGNYIGLEESPNDMYGKIMSLPDISSAMDSDFDEGSKKDRFTVIDYFNYLTDISEKEIANMDHDIRNGMVNPMELKKMLARVLVTQFHDKKSAELSEIHFEQTIQQRKLPEDIPTFILDANLVRLSDFIVESGLAQSSSEARRLIDQGAVRINDKHVRENITTSLLKSGDIIRIGKRRFIQIG
tara:strand:- start:4169 stop:5413 length:1245 start_codon:yes stop_codon:yes gene_type:complete